MALYLPWVALESIDLGSPSFGGVQSLPPGFLFLLACKTAGNTRVLAL